MNRRSLLRSITKPNELKKEVLKQKKSLNLGGGPGLAPYTGPWNYNKAKHLLRRAMVSPNMDQIEKATQDGLTVTINQLFAPTSEPAPPVNPDFTMDPYCAVGETWVDKTLYFTVPGLALYRVQSLVSWAMGLMLNEGVSIKEKMTLFWYNHFVTESVQDARAAYINNKLYREYALGNFKEFTKKVVIDPAMLNYLNGNLNTKKAPNENFARELLELFTIGKGPLVAPGDYTNYTEQDIKEMAKVLTGWRDITDELNPTKKVYSAFFSNNHDTSVKTLSSHFGGVQISNLGDQEYAQLIDIIFQQAEVARFISRKLYRWFVYHKIDDTIEQDVIQPMADMLISNNYEIEPVVKALLSSQHFFQDEMEGCMIKTPIDFVIGAFKMNNIPTPGPADIAKQYNFWFNLFNFSFVLQQAYFYAPNVAGWTPFYQEPSFYQIWINSVTLTIRVRIMDALNVAAFPINGVNYRVDVLTMAKALDNPSDPTALIDEVIKFYLPKDLSSAQKTYLKNILIPGLPDYVWTVAWEDYLNDQSNPTKSGPIENQLRYLLYALCDLSEFQLC